MEKMGAGGGCLSIQSAGRCLGAHGMCGGEGAVVDMLWFGQSGFFSFLSHTLAYCMRNVIKGELPAQVIVLSSTRHPVAASRQPGVVSHLMLTHCLT